MRSFCGTVNNPRSVFTAREPDSTDLQEVGPVTGSFIGYACQHHELIGCSEARTVDAQTVCAPIGIHCSSVHAL